MKFFVNWSLIFTSTCIFVTSVLSNLLQSSVFIKYHLYAVNNTLLYTITGTSRMECTSLCIKTTCSMVVIRYKENAYVCMHYAVENPNNFTTRNRHDVEIWYKQEIPAQITSGPPTNQIQTTQAETTEAETTTEALTTASGPTCPANFTYVGSACFYTITTAATGDEAPGDCQAFNSDCRLAKFTDVNVRCIIHMKTPVSRTSRESIGVETPPSIIELVLCDIYLRHLPSILTKVTLAFDLYS